MEVKFKKLQPDARLPEYAHRGDAGADLFSLEDKTLQPGERYVFKLGLAAEFSNDLVAMISDKGGLAGQSGITTLAGVIDAGYRGEWVAVLLNTSQQPYEFKRGDKLAQVIFQKIDRPQFKESELSETTRADGKFGSTGR